MSKKYQEHLERVAKKQIDKKNARELKKYNKKNGIVIKPVIKKEKPKSVKIPAKLIYFAKIASDTKLSYGEQIIKNYLIKNKINFFRNYYFKDFVVNGSFKLLLYDFYIKEHNLIIEFDGEQHYTKVFNGKLMQNQEAHDFLKNCYCAKNNIKILRIKYDKINNINEILDNIFKTKPLS